MSPLLALLAALPATLAASDAQAQAGGFPAKPVRIVVGFVPGGSTDITGRVMAQRFTDQIGQPVVVENRPGAGGNVGAEAVARAPADGYTLMLTSIAIQGIGPALYPKLPFDPIRDFTPITQLTAIPNVLAVHPSLPAKSVSELIAGHPALTPDAISAALKFAAGALRADTVYPAPRQSA